MPGPGEKYKAPKDDWLERQRLATEEPGVLAGFSHVKNLPKLTGTLPLRGVSELGLHTGYVFVPLVRRVDLDRVYRATRESGFFHRVYPYGTGKKGAETVYKERPWSHLNCYQLRAKLNKADHWCHIGAKYILLQS